MKKIAILLSFLAQCVLLPAQVKTPPAQNAQPKRYEAIRVIKDHIVGINVAVEFWDSTTNKLLKRLDLVKISPFYNLKGREFGLDEAFKTPCYKVPFSILRTDPLFMLTDEEMQNFFPNSDSVGVRIHSWITDRLDITRPREEIGILHVMEVGGHRTDFAAARLALAVYDKNLLRNFIS